MSSNMDSAVAGVAGQALEYARAGKVAEAKKVLTDGKSSTDDARIDQNVALLSLIQSGDRPLHECAEALRQVYASSEVYSPSRRIPAAAVKSTFISFSYPGQEDVIYNAAAVALATGRPLDAVVLLDPIVASPPPVLPPVSVARATILLLTALVDAASTAPPTTLAPAEPSYNGADALPSTQQHHLVSRAQHLAGTTPVPSDSGAALRAAWESALSGARTLLLPESEIPKGLAALASAAAAAESSAGGAAPPSEAVAALYDLAVAHLVRLKRPQLACLYFAMAVAAQARMETSGPTAAAATAVTNGVLMYGLGLALLACGNADAALRCLARAADSEAGKSWMVWSRMAQACVLSYCTAVANAAPISTSSATGVAFLPCGRPSDRPDPAAAGGDTSRAGSTSPSPSTAAPAFQPGGPPLRPAEDPLSLQSAVIYIAHALQLMGVPPRSTAVGGDGVVPASSPATKAAGGGSGAAMDLSTAQNELVSHVAYTTLPTSAAKAAADVVPRSVVHLMGAFAELVLGNPAAALLHTTAVQALDCDAATKASALAYTFEALIALGQASDAVAAFNNAQEAIAAAASEGRPRSLALQFDPLGLSDGRDADVEVDITTPWVALAPEDALRVNAAIAFAVTGDGQRAVEVVKQVSTASHPSVVLLRAYLDIAVHQRREDARLLLESSRMTFAPVVLPKSEAGGGDRGVDPALV